MVRPVTAPDIHDTFDLQVTLAVMDPSRQVFRLFQGTPTSALMAEHLPSGQRYVLSGEDGMTFLRELVATRDFPESSAGSDAQQWPPASRDDGSRYVIL